MSSTSSNSITGFLVLLFKQIFEIEGMERVTQPLIEFAHELHPVDKFTVKPLEFKYFTRLVTNANEVCEERRIVPPS